MVIPFGGLSPGELHDRQRRLQSVTAFWTALGCRDDAGETTWGVLEELQLRVSECLSSEPVNLAQAEALTAQAALLLIGRPPDEPSLGKTARPLHSSGWTGRSKHVREGRAS